MLANIELNMFFQERDVLELIDENKLFQFLLIDWGHSDIRRYVEDRLSRTLRDLFNQGYIEKYMNTERGDVFVLTYKGFLHLRCMTIAKN